jgi:hypothetical protein
MAPNAATGNRYRKNDAYLRQGNAASFGSAFLALVEQCP